MQWPLLSQHFFINHISSKKTNCPGPALSCAEQQRESHSCTETYLLPNLGWAWHSGQLTQITTNVLPETFVATFTRSTEERRPCTTSKQLFRQAIHKFPPILPLDGTKIQVFTDSTVGPQVEAAVLFTG